jgi:folate-binding protein YgfZ
MTEIIQKNCQVEQLDLGVIQVTGKNAGQFLQGQLTCDVTEVNAKHCRLGAHCDAKGRVQATFYLFFHQGCYYFLLPREMIVHLLSCLTKYAVFSAVNLIDVSQSWKVIGVAGPLIGDILNKYALLPSANTTVTSSDVIISVAIAACIPRFVLLTAYNKLLPFIDHTFNEMTVNDWHLLDIIAGISTIYPETIGQFTPHQLNYPAIGGVSFTKGCYIGQEIIARTHYLGKSKSRLYRLAFQAEKNFSAGTLIQDSKGATQGVLIIAAHEKNNHFQALACLQTQTISHTIYLGSSQGPVLRFLE